MSIELPVNSIYPSTALGPTAGWCAAT